MIETIETKEETEIYFSASSFIIYCFLLKSDKFVSHQMVFPVIHNLPRKESQMFVHIVWLLDNTDY